VENLTADRSTGTTLTGSGPAGARLFHRLLAVNFVIAWLSLSAPIDVLIGSRGRRRWHRSWPPTAA